MTPEERQALRDKHANSSGTLNGRCVENCCAWCTSHKFDIPVAWPCDVIKVLDATEPAPSDTAVTGCDHWYGAATFCEEEYLPFMHLLDQELANELLSDEPEGENICFEKRFAHCPKCGGKL